MLGPAVIPQQHGALHSLLEAIIMIRRSRDIGTASNLVKATVDSLLEAPTHSSGLMDAEMLIRYRDLHLRILKTLQDPRAYGVNWTNKFVTKCLTESREEIKYNFEATDYLIR